MDLIAKLSWIITILSATSAAAEENNHSCVDDDGSDGSCSAEAKDATTGEDTTRRQPPRRNRGGINDLPAIYLSQLDHIDELRRDEKENADPIITCDEYLDMDTFIDPVAITDSLYQEISWAESTEKPDKCLTLDDTLQICDSYRPHYHEYFVHFPASFLPQMKRAIFVGGGDSMLLHELLKYPDIELIVGLELDQAVVRDSLKHFFTQPHFDMYPKVQWWFGDAAKSLLLLPKEWFGTFDLVMVDLSETVMGLTVSEELDILKALALLLNPHHGIFVKNERYIEDLNDIFDHVIQIYLPDTPLLCDQDWVFGSYGVDFLHPDFERYKIPTFHYKPRENSIKHHGLIREYSKNDINMLSHCKSSDVNDVQVNDEGKKLGVLMVVEAERAKLVSNYGFNLEENLLEAINGVGSLHIVASETFLIQGQSSMIILQEGYIVAKAWPNLQYCAFDIAFWGRFDLIEATRKALLHAVGVDTSVASSFRIVVGGMYGTDTWRKDLAKIGPKKINKMNCNKPDAKESKPRIEEIETLPVSQIAIQESLAFLPLAKTVAVVFCGPKSEGECESLHALSAKIEHPIAIWSCPKGSYDENVESDNLDFESDIFLCGKQIGNILREIISSRRDRLGLVVIDSNVPSTSVIDLANALTKDPLHSHDSLMRNNSLIILPKMNHIRTYFLEICRLNLLDDLLRMAVVSISQVGAGGSNVDQYLGCLTLGNPLFFSQLVGVMDKISERTTTTASLLKMKSSPVQPQSSFSPHHYTMFDYDEAPGMKQYSEQMPVGKQTLLQLKFSNTTITKELLNRKAEDFLQSMKVIGHELNTYFVGDGIILYCVFTEGHMIVVWNGRQNIDMNIFSYDETMPHKDLFEEHFMPIDSTSILTLWEEEPRGVGKVINFSKDIIAIPGCVDRFILCDKLAELGECEVESEKKWMFKNCPLACDRCPEQEPSR